jgi:hypothetical protein
MGKWCSYPHCITATKRLKNVPFVVSHHTFPTDPEVSKQWRAFLKSGNKEETKAARLCSLHFSEKSFSVTAKRRLLKKDAIPVYRSLEEKIDGDGYELYEVEATTTDSSRERGENVVYEIPVTTSSMPEQIEESSTIDEDEFIFEVAPSSSLFNTSPIDVQGSSVMVQDNRDLHNAASTLNTANFESTYSVLPPEVQESFRDRHNELEKQITASFMTSSPSSSHPPHSQFWGGDGQPVSAVKEANQERDHTPEMLQSPSSSCDDQELFKTPNRKKRRCLKYEQDDSFVLDSSAILEATADTDTSSIVAEKDEVGKYLLVQQTQIYKLLNVCRTPNCLKPRDTNITKDLHGSAVVFKYECTDGHKNEWATQEKVKNRNYFMGNVAIVMATILCGLTFTRVSQFFELAGIRCISRETYRRISKYVEKAVDDVYTEHVELAFQFVTSHFKDLFLCGDARYA